MLPWLQLVVVLVCNRLAMALLFPAPSFMTEGHSVLAVTESLDIIITADGTIPEDLKAAAERMVEYVTQSNHHYLSPDQGKEYLTSNDPPVLTTLEIILRGSDYGTIASEVYKEAGARREAYELDIPADGTRATLKAHSSLGAFRGLATFEQLFYGVPVSTLLPQ